MKFIMAPVVAFFATLKADLETLRAENLAGTDPLPRKTLHIGTLAVDTAYRGRGLGRKLLEAVLQEAQRQGYDDAFTEATSASQYIFEKVGFYNLRYIKYSEFYFEGKRPLRKRRFSWSQVDVAAT